MSATRTAALLVVPVLVAACASGPRWVPAEGTFAPPSRQYTIQFPSGWLRLGDGDAVVASHDGVFLQRINVFQHEPGTAIRGTKKTVTARMLPQEVAEVVHDSIASSPGMQGVTVLENSPAQLDGRPGFKLVMAYKDGDGLRMKSVVYGAVVEERLYEVSYTAAERHYFDRDLPAFEQVRSTLRFAAAAVARAKAE